MSTVHETAALLPNPTELRSHLSALAILDATIGGDPQFCCYTFDTAWGPGEEAALMENGSGDDFSVLFTPAGVLIRGFDHESEMSPYATDGEQVWPGVIDEVPATLRQLLDEPAFHDEGIDAPRVTACLWRKAGDTAWRAGSAIAFPPGSEDPDGSGFLFHLLTDRSPEAVQAHFEDYYERPIPLDAVRHVLAGRPLTPAIAAALNPAALSDNALLRRIAAHPEAASYLACDGEFDLARTDPVEPIALPNGLPVEPIAGCNAGGTHYLCGPAALGGPRPGTTPWPASDPRPSTPITSTTTRTTPRSVIVSSPPWDSPRPLNGKSWAASSPPPPEPCLTASSRAAPTRRTPPSSPCSPRAR
ncbi:hypothetical protein ACFRCI_08445 [Streptomyces sp. NPDC056638]|uniref:hypothetical protein n=1 Tax=Streptomyces sp. NPDC056638 TaxID=3345887 RepID=UPI00369BE063